MIRQQQSHVAGHHADADRPADHGRHVARPEPHRHRGSIIRPPQAACRRLKAGDEIHDDQREKRDVHRPTGAADGAQKSGVDAFEHKRTPDQRENQDRDRGDRRHQQQRRIIERQHVAEQEVQEVELVRAAETSVTPSASDTMKKAASAASSLIWVVRAMSRPAPHHDAAMNPPSVMANRLKPATMKPSAAPAGSHGPWRRPSGSCGAASAGCRPAPRHAPARRRRPARGA